MDFIEIQVIQWRIFLEKNKLKFFSHETKICIAWNLFLAKIILVSQKYLFWG